MGEPHLLYPEDRIPLGRLVPMGLQHVVAMFGATVLAPVIMGFDPQTAIFFSGIGTLIFLACTRMRVPSYLGSSFSFIGPVLAVTGGNRPGLIIQAGAQAVERFGGPGQDKEIRFRLLGHPGR